MKHEQNKRWITINVYVDIETGEIIGTKKPKNYQPTKEINKTYKEDEKYRIIERTIGVRRAGEQTQLDFREYRIQ